MGSATLVLTDSLRDLIERQRGTSTSRTAVAIRHRSGRMDLSQPDRHSRNKCSGDAPVSTPLFERE